MQEDWSPDVMDIPYSALNMRLGIKGLSSQTVACY